MNPYQQIAKDHLSKGDLLELLAELDKPAPLKMSYEQSRINHYSEAFKNSMQWVKHNSTSILRTKLSGFYARR